MTRQVRLAAGAVVALALVLALLVVLLVTRSGDGTTTAAPASPSGSATTAPGTTSTPGSTDGAPAGLERFYGQTLAWTSCGGDKQCAELTVPVDYADPTGQTIQLKLARVQATDPAQRVGSLVVNPGGPGAPGTSMVDDPSFYFGEKLLAREDIVAFDPRGTGESDPVTCLDDSQLDTFLAENPAPSTKAGIAAWTQAQKGFWAACQQNSDALLGHVSTVEAAKDMDVLRAALGEQKLAYLGFSYGTKLGATYASLFPERAGRMVLDGAVDPDLDFKQAALVQAGGFETALRAYVQHCLDGGSCFLGSTMDAALTRIQDFLSSVAEKPLPTSSGRMLSVGNAFYGIATPLYNKDYWTILDQALRTGLQGDGSVLMTLSDAYASRNPDGSYADNSAQAFPVISCLDDPSSVDPTTVSRYYGEFEKASPTFGKVFAWGLATCYGDPSRAEDPAPTISAAGAEPIIVIGTTRDPATPLSEAISLAKELATGVLITRDGDGHTGYHKGNSCVDDAVEGYLLDGTAPTHDLSC